MSIPRFLRSAFPGFQVLEMKEWLQEGRIEIHLRAKAGRSRNCHRCRKPLEEQSQGKYRCRVEAMPVMGHRLHVHFWRERGYCRHCRKYRVEYLRWLSEETPHLTQDYAWWLGRLCEIAPVSRVAGDVLS